MMKVEQKISKLLKYNTVIFITVVSAVAIDNNFDIPSYGSIEPIHISLFVGFSLAIFGVIGLTVLARKTIVAFDRIQKKVKELKI